MIILDIPQGSIEWIYQRIWRLTASSKSSIITSKFDLSKSVAAEAEYDRLIAGIKLAEVIKKNKKIVEAMNEQELNMFMADYGGKSFMGNQHTQRGNDLEHKAIAALSEVIDEQINDIGMVIMGDSMNGVVSCSPDGEITRGGKFFKGAEVKAQNYGKYVNHVRTGGLPKEHELQVHFSMVVCDCDSWHFGSYFEGEPIYHYEQKRNERTDKLQESLLTFEKNYREKFEEFKKNHEKINESRCN